MDHFDCRQFSEKNIAPNKKKKKKKNKFEQQQKEEEKRTNTKQSNGQQIEKPF